VLDGMNHIIVNDCRGKLEQHLDDAQLRLNYDQLSRHTEDCQEIVTENINKIIIILSHIHYYHHLVSICVCMYVLLHLLRTAISREIEKALRIVVVG